MTDKVVESSRATPRHATTLTGSFTTYSRVKPSTKLLQRNVIRRDYLELHFGVQSSGAKTLASELGVPARHQPAPTAQEHKRIQGKQQQPNEWTEELRSLKLALRRGGKDRRTDVGGEVSTEHVDDDAR